MIIITASVLSLIAVILLSPIRLGFSCRDGDIDASVSYLFIKIDLSPKAFDKRAAKKTKKKDSTKQKDKKKEEQPAKEPKKSEKASDTLKTVMSLIQAFKKAIDIIRRHLVFYSAGIYISVSCADAYRTGVCYSAVYALVHTVLAAVGGLFVLKPPDIYIAPDFLRGNIRCDISFRVRIRPFFIIWAGIYAALKFVKIKLCDKGKRQNLKGGKKHEPTTAASH